MHRHRSRHRRSDSRRPPIDTRSRARGSPRPARRVPSASERRREDAERCAATTRIRARPVRPPSGCGASAPTARRRVGRWRCRCPTRRRARRGGRPIAETASRRASRRGRHPSRPRHRACAPSHHGTGAAVRGGRGLGTAVRARLFRGAEERGKFTPRIVGSGGASTRRVDAQTPGRRRIRRPTATPKHPLSTTRRTP